ncbi:MAG: ribonuclease HII, partial [Candidatus Pacebacteria bacterium]|nr:ribonuclease HII [Candidatus Paceibacterota bacterium]
MPGLIDLFHFERIAWQDGYRRVAGVDEVGRGPIAGPVVAAAVILPRNTPLPAVADSKTLSASQREELCAALRELPEACIGVGSVAPSVIDRINILRATHRAMREAVSALSPPPDFLIVDGRPVKDLPIESRAVIKGDSRSASVAAASIVAKVMRDRLMTEYDRTYPGYGFATHKGYATKNHLDALKKLGACTIHRTSFAPVARVLKGAPEQLEFN